MKNVLKILTVAKIMKYVFLVTIHLFIKVYALIDIEEFQELFSNLFVEIVEIKFNSHQAHPLRVPYHNQGQIKIEEPKLE